MAIKLPPEFAEKEELVTNALINMLTRAEEEDKYVRYYLLREAKRNDLFWHGFQHIFWDSASMDWRVPTHEDLRDLSYVDEQTEYLYDYVVNIIKSHGESIMAALSAEIPTVRFKPFDPDSSTDVSSAKEANEAAKKIGADNQEKLIFLHSLFTLYTQHILGGYTYSIADEDSPPHKIPKYKNVDKTKITSACENCPYLNEEVVSPETTLENQNCPECANKGFESIESLLIQ